VSTNTANLQATAQQTISHDARLAIATDVTNSSAFAALADTLTPPAATSVRAVFTMRAGSILEVFPVGTGADNTQGRCRIVRHFASNIINAAGLKTGQQWHAQIMSVVEFTLSARVGVASGHITASHRYADTLTEVVDKGFPPAGVRLIQGSSDDDPASIIVDPLGADFISIEFTTSGTATPATTMNALERVVSSS
jgi:hypothetical protein